MKNIAAASAALALLSTTTLAGGLDRSGQDITWIFDDSGTLTASAGRVTPSVTGTDDLGNNYDVAAGYNRTSLSYTHNLTDKLTLGVQFDQPYGADILYNNSPLTSTLGGTSAKLDTDYINILARYRISDRFSVHGGVRGSRIKARVTLNGTAYRDAISARAMIPGLVTATGLSSDVILGVLAGDPGAIAAAGPAVATISSTFASTSSAFEASGGYALDMEQDTAYGYTLGVAYEIPEIALRAALTYFSEVEHTSNTTENLLTLSDFVSDVTFHSPQAVNLNFQTGIAQDTLLTANIRWANWGDVDLAPTGLGSDLINLDDSITYSLGIGRRFNENFSGSISVNYEAKGDDNLVSPLGPTDGLLGVTIGGRYKKDNMTVTGGINYSWIGDARPEVGGRAVANFKDNSSVGFGIRVSFAL